ncbi:hypothetical protein PM8797T_21113 [Gimesia maris DSM 8797]|nr:hypothetical protein PM8797T_21113 [Gimesia maris DSM 8797]
MQKTYTHFCFTFYPSYQLLH